MRSLCSLIFYLSLALPSWAGVPHDLAESQIEQVETSSPAYSRGQEIRREARSLREAGDEAGLEKLAGELRASKERLDDGTWMLSVFYEALTTLGTSEGEAKGQVAFFEKWANERPDSLAAQASLVMAYQRYAWVARGNGWASTVSKEAEQTFEERLEQANDVLERTRKLAEQGPEWVQAAQGVALGQGWDREVYMKMVNEALAKEPTYGRYVTSACYWLLPRWYGEEGDFEAWLSELIKAKPEREQARYYAELVWLADRMRVNGEMVFAPGRLDWTLTRRGFTERLKSEPENLAVRFEFIKLALLANDRATVREQFEQTGPKYFSPMWSGVGTFQQAWKFAFQNGPNPLLESSSRRPPMPKLDERTREQISTGIRVGAKLIGGFLAGAFLLGLAGQRGAVLAGFLALAASLVLAALLGTISTVLPAAALWLYLRRRKADIPPPLDRNFSGWITLLGAVLVAATFIGLQFGASLFFMVPEILKGEITSPSDLTTLLTQDGAMFSMINNSAWLAFLLLLLFCGRQTRESWQRRLGLAHQPLRRAWPWLLAGGVAVLALGILSGFVIDHKSRHALEIMALGRATPILMILCVALIDPILEELLYRGYAYGGWIEKIGFPWTCVASSLIFMATHLQYGWIGLAYVFGLGVIFSMVRWGTGNIFSGLILHMLNNLGCCIWYLLKP